MNLELKQNVKCLAIFVAAFALAGVFTAALLTLISKVVFDV